jgi:hypothetical protein
MAEMPVSKEILIAAKKNAITKDMYGATLKLHCLECIGCKPIERLCQGCSLFKISTQSKRQKFKKSDLRKMIKEFCMDCVGTQSDICQSPGCALYPFRRGERLTKAEWKASVIAYGKRRRGLGKLVPALGDNNVQK